MKKIILTALFILTAILLPVYSRQGEDPESGIDYTDETTILMEDTEAAGDAVSGGGSIFSTWDIIKILLILGAVILIIYILFYVLKKTGGPKYQNDRFIKLLGSQSLTQNGSVHLIEVAGKYYLVGCGDGAVSHIADVDDKETVDEIILKKPPEREGGGTFSDVFNSIFKRKTDVRQDLTGKIESNNKFMRNNIERLKKM
jgi:flagellar biosynthetic protein FliO